jgi:hypothetical protein
VVRVGVVFEFGFEIWDLGVTCCGRGECKIEDGRLGFGKFKGLGFRGSGFSRIYESPFIREVE